jgi:hypothetical protein
LSLRHAVLPSRPFVEPLVGGFDNDTAAVRHGVARIDAEVKERVLELRRVHQSGPCVGGSNDLDRYARANGALNHLLHAADKPVHIRWLRVESLSAREHEKAVRPIGGAFHRALCRCHVAIDVGMATLLNAGMHQFQRAGDARQKVIEIMRQAARECPTASIFCAWRRASSVEARSRNAVSTRSRSVSFSSRNAASLRLRSAALRALAATSLMKARSSGVHTRTAPWLT